MDSATAQKPADKESDLGALPRWDLADLYPGSGSPELARDLKAAEDGAKSFQTSYQGKLAALPGATLGRAVAEYERLQETLGRIMSYAGLVYAADQSEPRERPLFPEHAGEGQRHLDPAAVLHPRAQPPRRLPRSPRSSRRRNWRVTRPGCATCAPSARISFRDEIEKLLHEKYVAGRVGLDAAVRRDHGRPALPRRRQGSHQRRGAASPVRARMPQPRKAAAKSLGEVFGEQRAALRPCHQHARQGQGDRGSLARASSGRSRRATSANFVEDEVVDALISAVREAYPALSHRYYRLKAKWFGVDQLPYWDRNAPLPEEDDRLVPWNEAQRIVLDAYRRLLAGLARCGQALLRPSLDRRAGAAGQVARAPSPIPPCRSAHPYLLLNYLGQHPRRDDARARAGPRRASGAGGAPRRAHVRHAADARRDRLGLRRDADFPGAAEGRDRAQAAQGHARRQGRGHAQHRGAPDRLRRIRAPAA